MVKGNNVIQINGEFWFCYTNNRPMMCQIFKDFRDSKKKCPAKHMCVRPDRGNYKQEEEYFCFF